MRAKVPLVAALLALLTPTVATAADSAGAKSGAPAKNIVSEEPVTPGQEMVASPATVDAAEAASDGKPRRRKPSKPRKPRDVEPQVPGISAFETECAWTGKRITSLLKRDDVDQARQFQHFYTSFGCPPTHLGKAFGCVVAPDLENEPLETRVDRCWADPYTRQFSAPADSKAPAESKNGKTEKPDKPARTESPGKAPGKPSESPRPTEKK
ncbi:MAG: hypothetical protein H7840_08955 [Alphaproteobacteria bacterium]